VRPAEEPENPPGERLREKDLKGHIKPAKEDTAKPDDNQNGDTRETTDLTRDNQLKTAIDILKSWDIMKKNLAK
jgi:hypothetical protein